MTPLKWVGWAVAAAGGLAYGWWSETRQWRAVKAMHESPHRYL